MNTIKKGSKGDDVKLLQKTLIEKGYAVSVDGTFGDKTHEAVYEFQKNAKLTADGVVGPATWKVLLEPEKEEINFAKAAQTLNVEEAAIRAVHQVESGGSSGFLQDGRPIILFEGHIFWNQLKQLGINPEKYQTENTDILFQKWDKSKYKGGAAEYERLIRACLINCEAGLKSASYGMFQIMGFNHKLCGYNTVYEYLTTMQSNQAQQFQSFVKFLQNTKLDVLIRNLNWTEFAKKYNGPDYAQNKYDEKLKAAYLKFKK